MLIQAPLVENTTTAYWISIWSAIHSLVYLRQMYAFLLHITRRNVLMTHSRHKVDTDSQTQAQQVDKGLYALMLHLA